MGLNAILQGRVAEIDDVLARQTLHYRAGHGKPANAGVEDAYRGRGGEVHL